MPPFLGAFFLCFHPAQATLQCRQPYEGASRRDLGNCPRRCLRRARPALRRRPVRRRHSSRRRRHVHYAIPHSIAALLAQQMVASVRRLPYITTLHGTDITLVGADPSYFGITKFSIEKSDGITAVSDTLREQTVEIFGVPNEIRVIKNFVNCELYHPDNEKKGVAAYAPGGEKLLIHLSNFRPVKRVLDCIRILAEVRKSVPARLLMAGDGPERGPAEHLARSLKVDQHVIFLGKQNHVERLIPLAHVLLMPSEMESFGLAALEAMACGVVPVATRV